MSQFSPFTTAYLQAWTEPDDTVRRDIVERLWTPTGSLSVSPLGRTLSGYAAITDHLSHVHADLIETKGLTFAYDQELTSGDARLLRWSMTAPNGSVVGRGADTVIFDAQGRAEHIYMFMGVN